ncbi:DUF4163 domain-containing protein [Pseudoxanthomonas sp. UTMC 1351]|uniref:DUF3298 and DUF4163 domain-containing protein n=1 Tax=Pseudoxanthomonas sp. UTMC 1351 TaxID=2695853 RepID=UPI0034CE0DBC
MLVLAGCKREEATPAATTAQPKSAEPVQVPTVADPAVPVELKDVIETNDRYAIGISYPPNINQYPGLAKVLGDYSSAARAELMEAVEAFGNDKPSAPYELSLSFEQVVETPQLVAVAADGSRYTGGAHGQPLIARFVWLPQQNQLLTAAQLVPQPQNWKPISDYVRLQLLTAAEARAAADDLDPADRVELMKTSTRMIDEGTQANAENFSEFVPVLNAEGKIAALRFVFPPYQVGPYADGTQTVDVPAEVLRPHIAPEFAGLFAG